MQAVLYSFTGAGDGGNPSAGVIRDSGGNLYGTTQHGGEFGAGVLFIVDSNGVETALYNFTGGIDGGDPEGGVIRDLAGNLYGTTRQGGASSDICPRGCGTVFKLDTTGKETVLYAFKGAPDGAFPEAGVIRDSTGALYGTTLNGGSSGIGEWCSSSRSDNIIKSRRPKPEPRGLQRRMFLIPMAAPVHQHCGR